jgi:uncharacterized protein YggE
LRTWFVLGLVGLAGTPALAQSAACPPTGGPPASGPPVLRLAASSTINVPPDVLVADLTALANAPTAVPAQHRVNALMAEAGKAVAGVAGVKATFRGYSVQFVDERPAHWIAQQTLELRGTDSEVLLGLVGRLQATGLAIGDLGWQVSADHAEQARRDATITALKNLRTEATAAAEALGMEVDRFQSVRLGGEPQVFPVPAIRMNAAVAMAPAMAPPNATANPEDVAADVILRTAPTTRSPNP